uniref:Kinesin family member 25 n=1 Tax=Sinocyclocheilus rhinocerous TaxID=307959 RepID=A0A673LP22_9TELE
FTGREGEVQRGAGEEEAAPQHPGCTVHGPEDSQETVFEEVKPLLTSLLDGYNVCIMAYGQTGSGKTHTMIGSRSEDPTAAVQDSQQGIIPKAANELFKLISEKPADSHTVEMSVVEVYYNEVLDLLARDEDGATVGVKREVITTSTGTSEVPCLTYELVRSSAEVMQLINCVLKLRSHSPTLVHMDSSRSHFIVTLTVTSKSPDALALGMIYSVSSRVPQLIGFEAVMFSQAIRRYLSSSAECQTGCPAGGDAKLLIMLCVSPTQRFLTESLQSLGFGARARQVQREPPRRKNTALKMK